jgi:hypothetical protein
MVRVHRAERAKHLSLVQIGAVDCDYHFPLPLPLVVLHRGAEEV